VAYLPIQSSFAAGELSPRLRGRLDLPLYAKGLKLDEDWIPLSYGSALMRAGSAFKATQAGVLRSIPFNVSGGGPYVLALLDQELRIFSRAGVAQTFLTNLVTNGTFDAGTTGWTLAVQATWMVGGYVRLGEGSVTQVCNWVTGHTYTVRFRAKNESSLAGATVTALGSGVPGTGFLFTAQWANYSMTFTATADSAAGISVHSLATGSFKYIDDIFVTDDGVAAADHIDAPWTAAQVAAVQFDQDLTKNRMMLVHGNVAPQLLTLNVHGFFELHAATFVSPPSSWVGTHYPSTIDWGFQGRLWLGATPDEPNVVQASKSGYPFDFTTGAGAADGFAISASVRGGIRWLQGQKTLLAGAERVEQSIHGSGAVVYAENVQVEDESAFGSAAIQATHLGDEVLFVGRSLREVRSLSFDAQVKDGWVSAPVSLTGEHLVYDVKEVHFARQPVPTIFVLRTDGTMVACTYDKGAQVAAWWQLKVTGIVTACVVDSPDGDELILWVTRAGSSRLEIVPMHEVGAQYLDSHIVGALAGNGIVTGLGHLEGQTVRVVVDDQLEANQVVVGGQVQAVTAQRIADDPTLVGTEVVVGLAYRPKLITLPPLGAKKRYSRIGLRLNDSAAPLVNGKRIPDRTPATPMDEGEPLLTADVELRNLGWAENGEITIEQDLPFRTEILTIFGDLQRNES
jgi:hypothetical protein